jgi:trans-AT polyketide synthase, acyltransferase and oxidoreductase domains
MVTFVFPGQGSQSKGMGGALFDEFKELTAQADQMLGYSIQELCLEDPNLYLSQTQYTQPALYIVNAFGYLKRVQETGKKPDFVAGHSLGEYDALFAAGAYDFGTGLKLVQKRGELMSRATGGGMAAVVGLNGEQIKEVLDRNNLSGIDIANDNSPFQIVISGPKTDIDNAKPIFEETKGVKLVSILITSGAFHSRYMEKARQEFEVFLHNFSFGKLTIPVISNVHARPYQQSHLKQNLCEQITHPVKWTESIRFLMGLGEMEFEALGTGKTLTGLIQRIKREAEPLVVPKDEIEKILKKEDPIPIEADSKVTIAKAAAASKSKKEKSQPDETKPDQIFVPKISPWSLGSSEFKKDYQLKYAYLTGGMYRGVASQEMVVKMGKIGMMGFFGAGGLAISEIEKALQYIQKELSAGQAYGMNLVANLTDPEMEEKTVDLYLRSGVKHLEAAAFLSITPALVKYRAKGLTRDQSGKVIASNKMIAKISRPEVAEAFLSPAPERIVAKLLAENKITPEAAGLLKEIPMADDLCAEADSGGHTDGGVAYALMPAMLKLRDEMMARYQYPKKIRVGAAGGIGTPEAAAAAFILGADFILTGSINQCTVEANTSAAVKDLLQQMNVQDTEYAPAGDMFELGAKVQVLKKGLFFPARGNKLFDLYRQYNSLDEIDAKTRSQIQEKYFRRSFEQVYEDVKAFYPASEIEKAERNPKHKMALIFRWYFGYSTRLAMSGDEEGRVDYQVHCGPALGAFNQWVKGTALENWKQRHVDEIALKLMNETAELLNHRYQSLANAGN